MHQEHDLHQAIRTFRRWGNDPDVLVLGTETHAPVANVIQQAGLGKHG
ncbi:hypothetical protein [Deinococcus ruber]|nr:hypothetical protein [Deinococcus ruber]